MRLGCEGVTLIWGPSGSHSCPAFLNLCGNTGPIRHINATLLLLSSLSQKANNLTLTLDRCHTGPGPRGPGFTGGRPVSEGRVLLGNRNSQCLLQSSRERPSCRPRALLRPPGRERPLPCPAAERDPCPAPRPVSLLTGGKGSASRWRGSPRRDIWHSRIPCFPTWSCCPSVAEVCDQPSPPPLKGASP